MADDHKTGEKDPHRISRKLRMLSVKTGKTIWAFFKVYAIFLVIILAPRILLEFGQKRNTALYFVTILISFLYYFYFLWFFSRKDYFNRFDNRKFDGSMMPLAAITSIVIVGLACFASLTSFLSDAGYISLVPKPATRDFSYLIDFYSWHFFNLIPQVEINETMNWKAGYAMNDSGGRIIVLAFKIISAWIVIALFYNWNKWRKGNSITDTAST
jgi:hypothetical protein